RGSAPAQRDAVANLVGRPVGRFDADASLDPQRAADAGLGVLHDADGGFERQLAGPLQLSVLHLPPGHETTGRAASGFALDQLGGLLALLADQPPDLATGVTEHGVGAEGFG